MNANYPYWQSRKDSQATFYLRRLPQWFEFILYPVVLITVFIVMVARYAVDYREFHRRPELFRPPYSPSIKSAMTIPYATVRLRSSLMVNSIYTDDKPIKSIIGTVWNGFILIPVLGGWMRRRNWWLILTITRVVLAILLAITAGLQTDYLPRPLGSCKNSHRWPSG